MLGNGINRNRMASLSLGAVWLTAWFLLTVAAPTLVAAAERLRAPDLQSATARSDTTVRLTWRDTNTTTLTEFRVHSYPQGGSVFGPGWKLVDIPARKSASGISNYDVTGLTAGQTYCFFIYALAIHPNPEVLSRDFSDQSNSRCAKAKAPVLVPGPINPNTKAPPPPYRLPLPGGNDPIVLKPNLTGKISGPATLQNGLNAVYTIDVKNEGGAVQGGVEFKVTYFGALQPLGSAVISAGAGLTCEPVGEVATGTTGAFRCVGGTLAQGASAAVTFRAWATKAGQGNLVVEMNPGRTLDESNYNDNRDVIAVTVK